MRLLVAPVPVEPSPNAHTRLTIVPSESVDADESTDAVSPAALAVKLALGGTFGGGVVPPTPVASRSSYRARMLPPVTVELAYVVSRTPPPDWRPAVESVAVYCHVVGSVEPTFHARVRMVVGLVPSTCTRTRSRSPAASVRPGSVLPVSTVPDRSVCSWTAPVASTFMRAP